MYTISKMNVIACILSLEFSDIMCAVIFQMNPGSSIKNGRIELIGLFS